MKADQFDIAIIGGGAAGMMAALFSARRGAKVVVLERNEKLGKKVYITGKGRCNLTNAADPDEFMKSILRNPRFCFAALAALDNQGLMALIEGLGVPLKVERGERVFPQSDRASDVNRALERELQRLGVEVRLNARVTGIEPHGGGFRVALENGVTDAAKVILATGGVSYPATGSTGDGHRIAEALGHQKANLLPGLTAIETLEDWPKSLMGLTLKNVRLRAQNQKKKIYDEQGELLFTHFGISGPLALTLSSLLPDPCRGTQLFIDLKPALDEQTLDARILRDFAAAPNKQLISVMDGLSPHNLALAVLSLCGISPAHPVNSVSQAQRRSIVQTLKALPLTVKSLRGFNEAIITRGGIDAREINPSTMESRLVPGLYFAGELIDIDALTGGFNLQLAFSTGALAGENAAEAIRGATP